MFLLNEEEQKWYCYHDDELYWEKENCWGRRPTKPTPPIPPDVLAGRRPLPITILAYLGIIGGVLTLVSTPFLLLGGMTNVEGMLMWALNGAVVLAAGYGLLNLKRWTLPLFVILNVVGVVEHFVQNTPFTLNIVPLLVLFYLIKHHDLFNEKKPIAT
jgi:hypothetical protein